MRDPIDGSLLVTVCAQPGSTKHYAAYYSAIVIGVVSGPGLPPRVVEHHCSVPSKRCPDSNQTVPVIVDRADPTRIIITWNQVPVRQPLAQARSTTASLAATMRRKHTP